VYRNWGSLEKIGSRGKTDYQDKKRGRNPNKFNRVSGTQKSAVGYETVVNRFSDSYTSGNAQI